MSGVEQVADAAGRALYQGARPAARGKSTSPGSLALLLQFPPRPLPATWPATEQPAPLILSGLRADQHRGLTRLLCWLEQQPGDTWQDRWFASGADAEGNIAWRRLPAGWPATTGRRTTDTEHGRLALARGMSLLACADVIRPSLGWLTTPATPRALVTEITATRDPGGFANLATISQNAGVSAHTTQLALRRVASIVAAKGGVVDDITVGDCLELLRLLDDQQVGRVASSPYFYQLLRAAGVFGGTAPAVRGLRTPRAAGLRAADRPLRYRVPPGA